MRLCCSLGLAVVLPTLGLLGCSPAPGIKALEKPLTSGKSVEILDPETLSPTSRTVLREDGLDALAQRDPVAAINRLEALIEENETTERRVAASELAIKVAFDLHEEDPVKALGIGLDAVRLAEPGVILRSSDRRDELLIVFNESTAGFTSLFHETFGGTSKEISLTGSDGRVRRVRWRRGGKGVANPAFFDSLRPNLLLELQGFEERFEREGIGGKMVAFRRPTEERRAKDPFMPTVGYAMAATSLIEFNRPGRVEITLHDLWDSDEVVIKGRRHTLGADFTAPIAVLADSSPGQRYSWQGMLRPDMNADKEGLYLMAPYREDRIPLILVHGLMSSPLTWREVMNNCYADPVIRSNYQILVFFYPTGYPIAENAAKLRAGLRAFRERYDPKRRNPRMREMLVVGHSMGCNLTSFQIRDSGDRVWNKLFAQPIDELEVDDAQRETLRRRIYFKANPDISRVVFVCGPHRGSEIANNWIGRLGSRLVSLPFQALGAGAATTPFGESVISVPGNSIDNLEVNSPVLTILLEQPMTHEPVYHSIIGDRGKGDSPNSSDGVVPYWSSHLKGAASEKIVPAPHTATNHPQTVEEIRRILYLHLGEPYRPAVQRN